MFLDAGVDVGEGTDGAGNGTRRDLGTRRFEACTVAVHLGIEAGEGQPHRRRLGMNAVAAADADRILVFEGAGLQRSEDTVHVGKQDVGSAHELDVEGCVEHVRRGHALMDEAAVGSDEFGEVGEEGDDVMLGDGLDLIDAGDVELCRATLFPDGLCRFLRDHADLGERVASVGLDLEPDAELGFGRPDGDHFGPGVAGDHRPIFPGKLRDGVALAKTAGNLNGCGVPAAGLPRGERQGRTAGRGANRGRRTERLPRQT